MVSRDRRDRIVLQKVRKQGIRFWHKRTLKILARDNLIPTFGLLVITVCLPKAGIKLL